MGGKLKGEHLNRLEHGPYSILELPEFASCTKVRDGFEAVPRAKTEELTRVVSVPQQECPGTGRKFFGCPGRELLPGGYERGLLAGVDPPAAVCEEHQAIMSRSFATCSLLAARCGAPAASVAPTSSATATAEP
jgi:hypothetical protein